MNELYRVLILLVLFGLGIQCVSAADPLISVIGAPQNVTPTITWNNPANITYGTALSNTQLNAVAMNNGSKVDGNFVYTPKKGTILSAGNAQTLHVVFTPKNTNNYNTASKDVQINVSKSTSTITWSNPANITNGTALSETQLNAVAKNPKGGKVAGNFTYDPKVGTILSVGNAQTLHADFKPNDTTNYTTASKDVKINVTESSTKSIPTITWSNPANITNGTALSEIQLNAVATDPETGDEVAGDFTYDPAAGTILSAGNAQPLHADFAPNDTTNYTIASKDVQINVTEGSTKSTPTITWNNPADITYGTALSVTQLNASATDPITGKNVDGAFVYKPAAGNVLGTGTHTLHVDFTPDDTTNYNSTSRDVQITVSGNDPGNDPINSKSELQLWTFDASKENAIPDNVYTASKDIPYKSNITLAYNSTLGSIDSRCLNGDSGETYVTGAYPTVNENLTFTMGVDSSSPWSYGYLRTSVAYIGVRHASDDSYVIESYWTSDDGSLLNSSFQIPASSVLNNRVTVSIHSYESNRTNVITAGPGMYVKTPYRTETTRKLPYTNVIQPLIFLDCYASGAGDWVNLHLYNITQSIPRDIITPYARNDIMGFGLDYPNVTNNQKGTDFLISHGQNATVYLSENNLKNSTDVEYDNSLFAKGFEEGMHFYPGLATESPEEAQATIDTQMKAANTTFGSMPVSWSSSENKDNVTHAIYAYSNYGALYRNGMMGTGYISNIDTLSNATWAWWSEGSEHGAVCPCFTHETDNSPAISYSIAPELFETFVNNLNSKGINLVGFSNWYYSSMAQTATTNILQSDANTMKFQLNTAGGYPVNMNVKTTISPSNLDCNGVSIPFKKTSDGIQFTSVGNGTYTLTLPTSPVIWEYSPQNPICGDTLYVNGSASPEEKVNVSVAFNKTVPVSGGKYEYTLENVTIPEGLNNLFTVEAKGGKNLNVRVKMTTWVTKSTNASEGTATVSQSNVPAGIYTVKIDGDSGEGVSEVNLKITASQNIQADSNGNFSYSYNTTAVPPGNFEVKVGNIAKEITLGPKEKPFPGYSNSPIDPNHDGLYEDINGNGILDFDDVVAYYNNMNWIEENATATLFDYNKNNLIDFDDVVKLYGGIKP
jgi:PKD repeat protein